MNKAYKQARSNKGSGGVDGLGVEELLDYLIQHKDDLLQFIIKGKYKPNPDRGVESSKEGGKNRQLGIPTVVDRVIQQAIGQILSLKGSPLSPLLSNIMLGELDKAQERRGHTFVRYADDCMILSKSKRAAERPHAHIIPIIEDKLYLKENKDKTIVAHVKDVKLLGYGIYINKGKGLLRVHPKSITRMKEKIKDLTCRSNGWGNERRKGALRHYITGWENYFKIANMKDLLIIIDTWYRRRLRMIIRKQWKQIKTRLQHLIKLGIPPSIMNGYKRQVTYFSQLTFALFECKLRNRRIPNGTYSGVRGQ